MKRMFALLFMIQLCHLALLRGEGVVTRSLSSSDGLSNSAVAVIYKDSAQVMWFGTWDGLNRFDGRNYTVYKPVVDNQNTLSSNIIIDITEQRAGILWVATTLGVDRMNTHTGHIDRYDAGTPNSGTLSSFSYRVAVGDGGILFCFTSDNGLTWFDEQQGAFMPLHHPALDGQGLAAMKSDAQGTLLLLTRKGEIYRIATAQKVTGEMYIETCMRILEGRSIIHMSCRSGEEFWLVDEHFNLMIYNTLSSNTRALGNIALPSAVNIVGVSEFEDDVMIAYPNLGLHRFSATRKIFEPIPGDEFQGGMMSLLYDPVQQMLWVGTNNGSGAVYLYRDNLIFGRISGEQLRNVRKSSIRAICEDPMGRLWVGSRGDGVAVISSHREPNPQIMHLPAMQGMNVMSMTLGPGNCMLMGTETGKLFATDLHTLATRQIDLTSISPEPLPPPIYCLVWEEQHSVLWIGTNSSGVMRGKVVQSGGNWRIAERKWYTNEASNPRTIPNNNVYAIVRHDPAHVWFSTRGGGVVLMDEQNETFTSINRRSLQPLSDNDVLCLYQGAEGALWAGTSNGFNRIAADSAGQVHVENYTRDEGLLNNTVHGILEDENGLIWVSSNDGISKLNPVNGRILNYAHGYGLQSGEFSDGAYHRSPSGELFFGGINGINYFYPSEFRERNFRPQVRISEFKINNLPFPLWRSIDAKGAVRLSWNQNFFSFGFIALDYINNANCEYSYILRGFNDSHVYLGTAFTAVFTNVPSGDYILEVQCTNGDKMWNEAILSLPITISHPWWKHWLAYAAYILFGGLLAWTGWNVINKRAQMRRALYEGRLTQKQQYLLYEAKLRFFTNVAHEFCSSLTLIYGPTERLLEMNVTDESARKYLRIIKSSAERMQRLINDIMDFQRAENDTRSPEWEKVDIYELLHYISDNFTEFAEQRRITFTSEFLLPEKEFVIDRDALEKILFNLISNAYKYTNEGGKISVHMDDREGWMRISVRNTGRGIRPKDIVTVFDRFHILDNFERHALAGQIQRTGIGLALTKSLVEQLGGQITVESVETQYTEFVVTLPPHELPVLPLLVAPPTPLTQLSTDGQAPLILVVDDEEQIRRLVCETLAPHYRTMEATDGNQALEMMRYKRPSLIISDVLMPGMNGVRFLEEVKNNRLTSHIPIVFLSAKSAIEDQTSNFQHGLEFFISKPFSPKHLLAVVDQIYLSRDMLRNYYNSSLQSMEQFNGNVIHVDEQQFMMRVAQIIEENLQEENLTPEFICNQMAISRIQFYRRIKAASNLSTSEFIRNVKLQNAARLIKITTLTIQEIMFRTGFNNKSYFYTIFKKEFGVSPKEYRSVIE